MSTFVTPNHEPAGVALLPPNIFSQGLIIDSPFLSSSTAATSQSTTNSISTPSSSASAVQHTMTADEVALQQTIQALEEKKRQISENYLHLIEETVDHFLASPSVGVKTKALSDRYLDEPPQNMLELRRNADLLANCTQDAFNPHSELNNYLITPLVHKVYSESLDPLRAELNAFWLSRGKRKYEDLQKRLMNGNNNNNTVGNPLRKLSTKLFGILQDIEHIDQMRELDSHSTAEIAEIFKNGGLSHVVPISGLALGRIHRMLNEHNTAIQHWSSRGNNNNNNANNNGFGGGSPQQQQHYSPPPVPMRR